MLLFYKGREHYWAEGVTLLTSCYGGYIMNIDERHLDNFDYTLADASIEISENEWPFGQRHLGKSQLSYWVDENNNEYDTLDNNIPGITKVKRDFTEEEIGFILSFIKKVAIVIAQAKYSTKFNVLNPSQFEMSTWEQQKAEAAAGSGPLIEALATARGITVAELITKINDKVAAYNIAVGELLGQYQAAKDTINACTTPAEVESVIRPLIGLAGSADGTLNL